MFSDIADIKRLDSRSLIEFFLLLSGIVALTLTLAPDIVSDGALRYKIVEALLNGEKLPEVKYSIVQPVLSMPIAWAAKSIGWDVAYAVSYFNLFAFLSIGVLIFKALILIYSRNIAIRVFLLLLSASMMPHHLQHYFGEVFSALAITAGFLLAYRRNSISAYILIGLGIANSPALLVPATVAAMVLIRKCPSIIKGVVVAIIIIAMENQVKFGSVAGSPYLSDAEKGFTTILPYSGLAGFSYPMFFGILSILFSFGKGLAFYIPGIFVFFRKQTLSDLRLVNIVGFALLAFIVALILIYAKWWAWYGGNFWGPRFFLILTFPAAIALATLLSSTKSFRELFMVLGILSLSTWVGVNGVVFGQDNMEICWQNNYQLEMVCWYVPEFSALWRPFVVLDVRVLMDAISNSQRFLYVVWQGIVLIYLVALVIGNMAIHRARSR